MNQNESDGPGQNAVNVDENIFRSTAEVTPFFFTHFDSKFSKKFQRQIRTFIDSIYKVYIRKFNKENTTLNKTEKEFFWIFTTFFINRKAGLRMDTETIKSKYFRKHSSQHKGRLYKLHDQKKRVKKIMKRSTS